MVHQQIHKASVPAKSGTTYKQGKYSVTVAPDGSIKVKHGDWLSKYSAAIFGNYSTFEPFYRKDRHGNYVPIRTPHLIFAGETLYFRPVVATKTASPGPALPTDFEKSKRAVEHFKMEHPDDAETAGNILPWVHAGLDVIEILNVMSVLGEFGEYLSPVGWILQPIAATVEILNGYNTPLRHIGLRSTAYAVTAWSFGDLLPPPPSNIGPRVSPQALQRELRDPDWSYRESAKDAAAQDQEEARLRQKAWTESRDRTIKALDDMVQKKNLKKEDCQWFYRYAYGNNDCNTLAVDKIMTEMADGFTDESEKTTFWNPWPIYPNS